MGAKIDQTLLCYPFQHAARFEDEGWQDDSAKIGAGSELRDDMRQDWGQGQQQLTGWASLARLEVRRTVSLVGLNNECIVLGDILVGIARRFAA